jgi:hypothetical protein
MRGKPGRVRWVSKSDKNPQDAILRRGYGNKILRYVTEAFEAWNRYLVRQHLSFPSPVSPSLLLDDSSDRMSERSGGRITSFLCRYHFTWFSMFIYYLIQRFLTCDPRTPGGPWRLLTTSWSRPLISAHDVYSNRTRNVEAALLIHLSEIKPNTETLVAEMRHKPSKLKLKFRFYNCFLLSIKLIN